MDGSAPSSNKKSETPSQQRSALRNLKASFNEEATPSGKAHDSDKENHDSNPHSRPQIIFELGVNGTTKTLLTYTHDGKSKTLKLGLVKGGTDQPNIPIKRRTAADHDVETSAGYFEVGNLSDGSAVLTYTPTQAGSLLIPVEGDTRELEENKPTRTHGYESIAFPKITESDDEEEEEEDTASNYLLVKLKGDLDTRATVVAKRLIEAKEHYQGKLYEQLEKLCKQSEILTETEKKIDEAESIKEVHDIYQGGTSTVEQLINPPKPNSKRRQPRSPIKDDDNAIKTTTAPPPEQYRLKKDVEGTVTLITSGNSENSTGFITPRNQAYGRIHFGQQGYKLFVGDRVLFDAYNVYELSNGIHHTDAYNIRRFG